MDSFNLYREAKDQYEKLIPERNDGLILLSLYGKFKDKDFTEENIIAAITKVFKDQGNESSRTEYNRNNAIILRFQESFLWRNTSKRTYQFKKYGLELCQNIEKRLIEKYNPAKIKRFFAELYKSLSENIEEGRDFGEWIEDHFELRLPELTTQIEILDQQVNDSVKDFKAGIKSEDQNILSSLREIEIRLEIIKEQATELRNAFQISYDIDDLLIGLLEGNNGNINSLDIQRVQNFHNESRSQLEQVSKRIEKIKPRIREFIYDFNQKNFDRKTKRFIDHLLEKSTVVREGSSKRIILPDGLKGLAIKFSDHNPKLNIIPNRNISPKLPISVTKKTVDTIKRKELLEKTLKWKRDKEKISYWTKLAFKELEEKGKFDFTPLFFKILKEDKITIAVKTAHSIIRKKTAYRNKYKIDIKTEAQSDTNKKGISIWQMTLQKK
ncbi:hypothetical protein [Leeuwenhoekiella palythoae]|uniref:Uncharacterized protein n=1 Tax=Leeuwenhoekiella palythoae TaxID=573501 RepID=A0A1M5ZCB1_9FLAO|nr:hypothetical protein [Leeuwenhoekiella palythoae]MAS21239.1 hypothetical protein [Leeuwenhoekiella sp.]MAZ25507.1 hypothetical protein [Cytophagaceae bacterium]MEC7785239.1 hypothetical protein [Bacteroidota bacterium]MAW93879.1 hypothetical protein [Leeuwenhoekiella sp.]SHI21847.1 hypothetical protein SAMN04487999_2921 [Leeuwenhoekiella palythoae]|tara:strand:+ start:7886 stop:9205 length:1320 start_codon:yes stop_codon:yes gene_type:complete